MNLFSLTHIRKFVTISYLYLFATSGLFAITDSIPERPNPPRLVNNLSKQMPDFLSVQDADRLERKLEDFANQTSNQIVIVIVDDLKGLEPYDFAVRLHHNWGVGQAKQDNGIVIVVKPTGGQGQRKSTISVGYGLEGAIPDLTAKQIVDNELNTSFAKGDVYGGFDKATDVLMSLAKGEYNSDQYGQKHSRKGFPRGIIIPLIFLIIFIIIRSSGGRGGRGGMSMGSGFLLGSMMGRGFGSGGGWGGGGSSGGFGGFGGGSAGGGGASGSW